MCGKFSHTNLNKILRVNTNHLYVCMYLKEHSRNLQTLKKKLVGNKLNATHSELIVHIYFLNWMLQKLLWHILWELIGHAFAKLKIYWNLQFQILWTFQKSDVSRQLKNICRKKKWRLFWNTYKSKILGLIESLNFVIWMVKIKNIELSEWMVKFGCA